jgi:predicted regulator of Ras-like GTPase activity (Roadblock/LC7/MglB family)
VLDTRIQPAMESVLIRLGEEISARAVLLLQEDGQILQSTGPLEESEAPTMAALVAAMIATGKSIGSLGGAFPSNPTRFACDSDDSGIYMVAVGTGVWLAALYDQPLNPGKLRLRVRQTAAICAQLGIQKNESKKVPENITSGGAKAPPTMAPISNAPEKITEQNSSLFTNITDDEIDRLFEISSS